ncbi:MAG TPA: DUF4087 domain-containing protein [Candidatus Saccharimonadales bacterium]|nr:DUF4087 domain-containing protein [Candidatus Saccharimonadales bacterium]
MKSNLTKLLSIAIGYLLLNTAAVVNGQSGKPDVAAANQFETRCGWLSNPTPANISLYDRDEEWIIGVQGAYQIEEEWDWPAFKRGQWVRTNGVSYGYGCACLRLRVNRETQEVLEIKSSQARPLSTCRNDRSLKRWKHLFK